MKRQSRHHGKVGVAAVLVATSAAAYYATTSNNTTTTTSAEPTSSSVQASELNTTTSVNTDTWANTTTSTFTEDGEVLGNVEPSFINHSLDFDASPLARKLTIDKKTYGNSTDGIFRDGFGREALLRGWNASGAVKLASMDFKPFKSTQDAATTFGIMGKQMGGNQVRFTIAWEGVHPAPDVIDYAYLDDVIEQMREAMKRRMYVVVDYHSDLYSRHTFTADSRDTGNGAPAWIVKGGNHGTDNCGLPCLFTWGAHKLNDGAVRSAMRAFWLNSPISTTKGTRYVQDEFVWQLGQVADYLNQKLTPEERDYLLGIEPLNEPFDGGIKELGLNDYAEFDNKIIWPFYQRVRSEMNMKGMQDKWVYAEPLVFWYTTTGVVAPATGRSFLKTPPGEGFVFAPHMYDQARMGVGATAPAKNAAYLYKLDEARDEARFLGGMPVFLGEYGMWNTGKGVQDKARIITGSIQALEISDNSTNKSRFADFYTPWIHGAQWHWNHYYGNSLEFQNGNKDKPITEFDAWNNENFSVVGNYSTTYNHQKNSVERAYPRRTQGDLMHFSYNAKTVDMDGKALDWQAVRVDLDNEFINREYFRDRKFALAVWRGRAANAPTEMFLPRDFDPSKTTVITEAVIKQGLARDAQPANTANEVLLTADTFQAPADQAGSGHRLLVWDDADASENVEEGIHFALVVEHTDDMSADDLAELQAALKQRVQDEKQSPIYLPSDMTFNGYAKDAGANDSFQLIEQRGKYCMDVRYANPSDGNAVQTYNCNGSNAQRWQYDATTGRITTKLDPSKCLTVKGTPRRGSQMEVRYCTDTLNNRQQFVKQANWGWALKSNQNLVVDAFGRNWSPVGLWTKHSGSNQDWQVRY